MAAFWIELTKSLLHMASAPPNAYSGTSPWRQEIQRRHIMLADDLARLDLPDGWSAVAQRDYLVNTLLKEALRASVACVGPVKWWWGTAIERAWGLLREVEERTTDLVRDEELPARAAVALAHAECYQVSAKDPSRLHLDELLKKVEEAQNKGNAIPHAVAIDLRSTIVDVLRVSHMLSDRNNQHARYLRNRLILASLTTVVISTLIVLTQWRLKYPPAYLAAPDGWNHSVWSYLVVVMLFGAIGALLTAIPVISRIPVDYSAFNLPLQQAVLKLVLGPLIAIVGLLLLSAGEAPVYLSPKLSSQLVLAILFGAGQQVVTQFVDERAKKILSATSPTASSL
jgi:hypothetical protein